MLEAIMSEKNHISNITRPRTRHNVSVGSKCFTIATEHELQSLLLSVQVKPVIIMHYPRGGTLLITFAEGTPSLCLCGGYFPEERGKLPILYSPVRKILIDNVAL